MQSLMQCRATFCATCTTFSTCDIKFSHHSATLSERDFFSKEVFYGSRTIAPKENCRPPSPPTTRLTLSQTLTLTKGQFSSGAIAWLPPTLKRTLTLIQTPTLIGGQFFSGEKLPGYPFLHSF